MVLKTKKILQYGLYSLQHITVTLDKHSTTLGHKIYIQYVISKDKVACELIKKKKPTVCLRYSKARFSS